MKGSLASIASSRSARVRLFFDQTSDEQLLVLAEVLSAGLPGTANQFSVHTFQHEDHFLERLVAADLPLEETSLLAGTVIRAVGQTYHSRNWMEVTLTNDQIEALGLDSERLPEPLEQRIQVEELWPELTDFHLEDELNQFFRFLLRSPTPFAMLSGPEHRFEFMNQPYVELIGKTTQEEVLRKPVREALPDFEGQPFFNGWMRCIRPGLT